MIEIRGSRRSPRHGALIIGTPDPAETITVTLRLRRAPGVGNLPDDLRRGARRPLSYQYFSRINGAAMDDLERVSSVAQSAGLIIRDISQPARSIKVSGTIAALEAFFGTRLHLAEDAATGARYRARAGSLAVPDSLGGLVVGAFGLSTQPVARPLFSPATPGGRKRSVTLCFGCTL
jgi:kumamolisin